MAIDIDKLENKIDNYFANITKDKLRQDLVKAGSEVYSDVDLNILDIKKEEIQSEYVVLFANAATAIYLDKHITIGTSLIVGEVNRPRYSLKEINIESSNQESNKIERIRPQRSIFPSSTEEDFLPWRNQYEYI